MKQIARILEDFGLPRAEATRGLSEEELETLRLEAFENGYQAGWEDASKAAREEQGHVAADFARNLQDLSFTYTEAQSQMLAAMKPLLDDIVDKILPETARETIGLRVKDQLDALARRRATQPVEVVAAPDNIAVIEQLTEQDFGFPLVVAADDTLSDGQVFLRFGEEETEIDLGEVTEGIRTALAGFFAEQERMQQHG